jgi:hypothetical protein
MKFISEYTDFYDYAVPYDASLVYERHEHEIKIEDSLLYKIVPEFLSTDYKIAVHGHRQRNADYIVYPFAVVFCGIVRVGFHKRYDYAKGKDDSFYEYNERYAPMYNDSVKNFFGAERHNVRNELLELGVPVLYITKQSCIANKRLIDIKFNTQFDAVQAHQEMEMFVGELQSNEKDVSIDDKYIKSQKGFVDCSFKSCKRG